MSRRTVRAAVKARLDQAKDQGAITGLATVYRAFPTVIPPDAFGVDRPLGSAWGVVAVPNLIDSAEARIALGGEHDGWKQIDYTLELQFFLRWWATVGDGQEATDCLDDFIDQMKALIRADRTAASSDIWQWGEAELTDRVGEPAVDELGAMQIWGAIRTQVTEMIRS